MPYNTTLATLEQVGSDASIFEKTEDFLTYGVAGTVLAAGTSFLNTGIALGNAFGAEAALIDTGEVLGDLMGDNAEAYYREHRSGIELSGLIVGSLLPGLAAIKVARGFKFGLVNPRSKALTGLRDAIIPQARVKTLTSAIRANNMQGISRGNYLKLFSGNTAQQAIEGAIYEAAVLVTMNQNPTLSRDELGYFETWVDKENLGMAAFGMAAGGVIGGAVGGLVEKGVIKRAISGLEIAERSQHRIKLVGDINISAGDKGAIAYHSMSDLDGVLVKLEKEAEDLKVFSDPISAQKLADINTQIAITKNTRKESNEQIAAILNKVSKGESWGNQLIDTWETIGTPLKQRANILANLTSLNHVSGKSFTEFQTFGNVILDDAEVSKSLFNITKQTGMEQDPIRGIMLVDTKAAKITLDSLDEKSMLDAMGYSAASSVSNLMAKSPAGKAISRQLRKFLSTSNPEYAAGEELIKQQTKYKIKHSKGGFLTPADADLWYNINKHLAVLHNPETMFVKAFSHLNDPNIGRAELSRLGKDKATSGFLNRLSNNKLLRHKYGSNKVTLNLRTGELVTNLAAPTARDFGKLEFSKGSVRIGNGETIKVNPLGKIDELHPVEASANYAWALSSRGQEWAARNFNALVRDGLDDENLVALTALQELLSTSKGRALTQAANKENIVVRGTDNWTGKPIQDTLSLTKLDEFLSRFTDIKVRKQTRMLTGDKSLVVRNQAVEEVAAKLDVDPEFVYKALSHNGRMSKSGYTASTTTRGTNGEVTDFLPTQVEMNYSKQLEEDLIGTPQAMAHVMNKIRVAKANGDAMWSRLVGSNADTFFDNAALQGVGSDASTFVDGITAMDSTTGAFKTFNSDYLSSASYIQAFGKAMNGLFIKENKEIIDGFESVIRAMQDAGLEAVNELSILERSVLRQAKFQRPTKNITDILDPNVVAIIADEFPEVTELMASIYKRQGMNINKVILTSEANNRVLTKIREVFEPVQEALKFTIKDGGISDATRPAIQEFMDSVPAAVDAALIELSVIKSNKNLVNSIKSDAVNDFLTTLTESNRRWITEPIGEINTARGTGGALSGEVIYPGALDTTTFNHIAFVRDVTGTLWNSKGNGVVVGHNVESLQANIDKLTAKYGSDVEIITNSQKNRFLQARQEYDASLSVSETRVDSSLKKAGILWDLGPEPDPNVAQRMINSLINQRRNVIRQGATVKLGQEFATLEQLDRNLVRSRGLKGDDPDSIYKKMMNQALGLSDKQSHTWWLSAQQSVEDAVSRMYGAVQGGFRIAKDKNDWESFDKLLEHYGLPKPIGNELKERLLANSTAPKPVLNGLVSTSNRIFATAMLRMDTTQSLVNSMSLPIMQLPEMKTLVHAVKTLPDAQRRISALQNVLSSPINDEGLRLPSNAKVMMKSINNFFKAGPEAMEELTRHDILNNTLRELRTAMEAATLDFKKDPSVLAKGGKLAVDIMSKLTDKSEQFVKFVAADSAMQILTILGIPKGHPTYWPTVKTFVSRVHGNYTAAQRPTMFQGWAGQAIGLFQTYQFNLFQQFLKHIEDGNGASKIMLGAQGSIFGAQSLPGFQYMNQKIANHTLGEEDVYSITGETLDNNVSDFLLYGAGSSMTKPFVGGIGIDLYSRGDLTPRTPIIIPDSFKAIPIIGAATKLITNVANTYNKIGSGAPVGEAFLDAIAHNGLNRPIAGLAQLYTGERTSNKGVTIATYNDYDFMTFATKLMGTKTLDEAVLVNAYYRAQNNKNRRARRTDNLGRAIKDAIRSDDGLTPELYSNFMNSYTENGGDIKYFRQWVGNNMTNASQTMMDTLANKTKSPEGKYMQSIMGARIEPNESLSLDWKF